ncbi:MAG: hypothetical protein JSW23_07310 [Planctomycetota bacterium]|nr:MAG: hypothetical protein JSW23_07310 [Planctomycetota bacterium]
MPYTVNGIGTSYFGSDNLSRRRDICEACGKESCLSSYDTTSYFVILFLPLIPLGKKRVLDECSSCTKHRVMPLKKWHETKSRVFEETIKKYGDNPKDSDAAKEVLLVRLAFDDKEQFLKLAEEVEKNLGEDAEVLSIIGSGCYNYGLYEQSERTVRKSISIKDDQQTRELLCSILIKQSRPAEAEKYIQHITEQQQKEKAGMLIYLATGYQAIGEHQKALEILDKALALEPNIKKKKDYKKIRKISQKNLHSKVAVLSHDISSPPVETKKRKSFSAKIAPYVGPAVLLAVILGYIAICFAKGFSTAVYFANGLSKPYNITVRGNSYLLKPKTAKKIKVGEGTLEVEIAGDWPEIAKQKHGINTNFFARPFADKIFVINPDETALLLWEETYYSVNTQNAPAGEAEILCGESFYVFDDIDYVFKAFPSTIKTSSERPEPRRRISFVKEIGLVATINSIAEYQTKDAAVEYLKKCLFQEPEITEYLYFLYSMLDTNEFIETIRYGIEARPIRIDWHRTYQEAKQVSDPSYDIIAEYKGLLETEPEKNVLYYLIGRVLADQNESEEYFLKSVEGKNPCANGYGALGFNRLCCGRFDEAVKLYEQAKNLDRERYDLKHYYLMSLKAAKMYEEALNECRNFIKETPYDYDCAQEEWELLIAMGEYEKAQKQAEKWLKNSEQIYSTEWIEEVKEYLPALLAYKKGNREDYIALHPVVTDPNEQFYTALNSCKAIDDALLPQEEMDTYTYLVLYISEKKYGSDEKADGFITKAIKQMSEGNDREEKYFADCMSGGIKPNPKEVCNKTIQPDKKRILLTTMGFRYPEHQKVYFELAEKLNFTRTYPYMFLKTILEGSKNEPL